MRMSSSGLTEEEVRQRIAAVSGADQDIDKSYVGALLEKLALRAVHFDETESRKRILDQSRFRDLDVAGWKNRERDGIDLNSLDNEDESDSFDFDSYSEDIDEREGKRDKNA